MLSAPCRAAWSKSCLCTPRGYTSSSLRVWWSGQVSEERWRTGVKFSTWWSKSTFYIISKTAKYYASFVFPEVLSPEVRGGENTWPNEAQRASLQRRHLCTHWARWKTAASPGVTAQHWPSSSPVQEHPAAFPRCHGRAASYPAQTVCPQSSHSSTQLITKTRLNMQC